MLSRFKSWLGKQRPLEVGTVAAALVIALTSSAAIAIQIRAENDNNINTTAGGSEDELDEVITADDDLPLDDETDEPASTPTALAVATFPPESESAIISLVVTTAVVNVETFETGGLAPDGTLARATTPEAVVYYDFGARLGDTEGNVVLGGATARTAEIEGALSNLGAIRTADRIVIEVEDGTVYVYQVFAILTLPSATASLQDVGCSADGCSGLGTLSLLGYGEGGTLLVQAQLLRGGP